MSERLTPLAEPENDNFKKKCRKDNFTTTELFFKKTGIIGKN